MENKELLKMISKFFAASLKVFFVKLCLLGVVHLVGIKIMLLLSIFIFLQ